MARSARSNQTAIERFWNPILVSALSEELDLISISAAAQVVRESMKSPAARQMGVPTVPLTDLYNTAGDYIRARGGDCISASPSKLSPPTHRAFNLQLRIRTKIAERGCPTLVPAHFAGTGWGL